MRTGCLQLQVRGEARSPKNGAEGKKLGTQICGSSVGSGNGVFINGVLRRFLVPFLAGTGRQVRRFGHSDKNTQTKKKPTEVTGQPLYQYIFRFFLRISTPLPDSADCSRNARPLLCKCLEGRGRGMQPQKHLP